MTATLPTTRATRRRGATRQVGRHAAELVLVIAGALLVGFSATNVVAGVLVAALVVVGAGLGVLLARPSLIVPVAIVSMWFDNAGTGPIRTGRVIAALLFLLLAFRVMTTEWRPPALRPRAWLPTAGFVLWATLSGFWSAQLGTWAQGLFELLLGLSYALVFVFFLESEPQLARGLKVFTWISVPISLLSWFLYRGLQNTSKEIGVENRMHGFTGNANVYAFVLMATVPICVVFLRRATTGRERLGYLGILGTLALALMASGSRSGLLAMGAMAMYVFVTLPGLDRRRRIQSSLAGGVFVVVGVLVAGMVNPDRFSLAAFFGDAGAGRIELWNAAVRTFGLRPVVGSGIGGFRSQVLDILTKVEGTLDITRSPVNRDAKELEAHNLYLSLLLDLGIVGLGAWAVQYLAVARNLWDMRRHPVWRDWVWALGGTHLCLLVTATFGSTYNMKFSWTVIGFAAALHVRSVQAARVTPGRAIVLRTGPPSMRAPLPPRTAAAPIDLRLGVPFKRVMAAAVVLGALVGGLGATVFGSTGYRTSAQVLVVNLDNNGDPRLGVQITDARIQAILTLARSDPFLAELKERARLPHSVEDLADMVDATRPGFSSLVRVEARAVDRAQADRMSRALLGSLDATVDRYRAGAIALTGIDGRAIAPDVDRDYRGPIYLRLWDQPRVERTEPRTLHNAVVGATLGGFLVLVGTLLAHRRPRLSVREDIDVLLGAPFLATLPRPRGGRRVDGTAAARAAADRIDAACPRGANVVVVAGVGSAALRARCSIGLALGLAAASDRPVVLVDLDPARPLSRATGLARSKGWTDLHAGSDSASTDDEWMEATRPLRRRCVSSPYRRLARHHAARVRVLPIGRHRNRRELGTVAQMLAALRRSAVVVVQLPAVPGPLPVQAVVSAADAAVLMVLDGWTPTEPARVTCEALDGAAPNRVGHVVIDQ